MLKSSFNSSINSDKHKLINELKNEKCYYCKSSIKLVKFYSKYYYVISCNCEYDYLCESNDNQFFITKIKKND
ncbi:MAG: hypothetical protein KatS3mg068_2668 [Candidatus Sericytochromatia bacterium]|nr:MAG: hypothetical protein KatS3mg068_2668 [Candidatus Sericytochromatia bacterium]